MRKGKDLNQECELFSGKRLDDVITINSKAKRLLRSTDLECRDEMLSYSMQDPKEYLEVENHEVMDILGVIPMGPRMFHFKTGR